MCGIAGIWSSQLPDPQGRAAAMLEALRHRGPDGRGLTSWPGGAAGMVRLALVDLSERGQQPLWSPDGRVAILFNGEMYNHAEHRARLAARGYPFKSESDTEVVLALYLEHGRAFVEHVRGMFAIAILDFRDGGLAAPPALVLARDPFGMKPLYVARKGSTVIFASEIRGLLASSELLFDINRDALADYLTFGFVLQPRTMVAGINMVERGTIQVHRPGVSEPDHRYWMMPVASATSGDFDASASRVRDVLEQSVRLHSMADTPVGAFLSGGVDSSAIVAMMTRHNAKLRTYTVRLTDSRYDESEQARECAARLGCTHTEVEVGSANVASLFDGYTASLDHLSADGFNTWIVSRAAARDVKGVLSGLGGDEWFGGYSVTQRMSRLQRAPAQRLMGRVAATALPLVGAGRRADQLARLTSRASPLDMWAAAHRIFHSADTSVLLGYPVDEGVKRLTSILGARITDRDPVNLACQLDVWAYMGCQLLRDSDATSMASSLELRVPFVDVEVAKVSRAIAPEHKISEAAGTSGKRVLVHAVRDLMPPDIGRRPKRGFALPFDEWLSGPLAPILNDAMHSLRERRLLTAVPEQMGVHQRWALLMLESWYRRMKSHAARPTPGISPFLRHPANRTAPQPMSYS